MKEKVVNITNKQFEGFTVAVEGTAEPDNIDVEIINRGPDPIDTPWLWCDHNLDGFSAERILEQIIPPRASDMQRVICITQFLSHHVLHTTGGTELAQGPEFYNLPGNPIYNYNALGCCSCGHFTTAAVQLIEALGWSGAAHAFTWKGHTVCMTRLPLRNSRGEMVGMDKTRWFMIDGDGIRGPVYSLAHPGELADLDELLDNHHSRIVFSCAAPHGVLASGLAAEDYARMVDSLDDNRFYNDQSFTRIYQGHTMRFVLRPGESLRRSFDNRGATTFENGQIRQLSSGEPCHMYGSNDGIYPKPQFERPHVFSNGVLTYRPDLRDPEIRQQFQSGCFSYSVTCPYGLVGASVSLKFSSPNPWRIIIRCGDERAYDFVVNSTMQTLDLSSAFQGHVYLNYQIDIRVPNNVVPQHIEIISTFLCNPRSLPFLRLGNNRISYRDFSSPPLQRNLMIRWRWHERDESVDPEISGIRVLGPEGQWSNLSEVSANQNSFVSVLVFLKNIAERPAEGIRVELESSRPDEDTVVAESGYNILAGLFEHELTFGCEGSLNLNTLSVPVTTVNNGATLRVSSANAGLKDRNGTEYLGTRLFRVYSRSPGQSVLSAVLPNGTRLKHQAIIRFH